MKWYDVNEALMLMYPNNVLTNDRDDIDSDGSNVDHWPVLLGVISANDVKENIEETSNEREPEIKHWLSGNTIDIINVLINDDDETPLLWWWYCYYWLLTDIIDWLEGKIDSDEVLVNLMTVMICDIRPVLLKMTLLIFIDHYDIMLLTNRQRRRWHWASVLLSNQWR